MNLSQNRNLYDSNVWGVIQSFSRRTHPFLQHVNEVFSRQVETTIQFSETEDNKTEDFSIIINTDNVEFMIDSIREAFVEYTLSREHLQPMVLLDMLFHPSRLHSIL